MLPLGMLSPHPGIGEARKSRLTADEARTHVTLLAIARAPLILGANLVQLDGVTRSLLTNKAVIAVNQASHDNHPVAHLPAGFEHVRVWVATGNQGQHYLAVFNLDEQPVSLETSWERLGFPAGAHGARELWSGQAMPASDRLSSRLAAHGSALYQVE